MFGQPIAVRRWGIEHEAPCFHCHRGTVQLIEIGPEASAITCTNCGVERHYTIHRVDVPEKVVPFESRGFRTTHDVWDLKYYDRCVNCGNCVDNEVNVDDRRIRTVCPACYYTRIYEFNMLSEPRSHR